jgi:hypothetical protein
MQTHRTVIGLGHKFKSGKDTLADFLIARYGFERIAFADALKRGCMELLGLSEAQVFGEEKNVRDPFWGRTPGEILQVVGTDLFRQQFDADVWVKAVHRKILNNPQQSRWVITDVRFPNEADFIKEVLGGLICRVDREDRDLGGRDPNHPSETALDEYTDWDYILDNNGSLQDLYDAGATVLLQEGLVRTRGQAA